jgi:oligoendopeptidase F
MAKKRKPIRIKKSRRGKLRKGARAKKGQKIPVSTLKRMKKSKDPAVRKRATFALNARKWRKR